MKIVVDRNIRAAETTFGRHADLCFMDGRKIRTAHLRDADALVIRTATVVDASLLQDTPVRFVGTTSIGIDHLDTDWLDGRGIAWANAPGCNADGTAQYTLAMIWLACGRLGRRLPDLTAAVIGRGNVGSRVGFLLAALGVPVVANDPPRADAGESGLVSLDEALAQDVVCLHVPLTRHGPYPTFRLMSGGRLARIRRDTLVVNTARGEVVDGDALLHELQAGRLQAALDVWPGEPAIDPRLVEASTVATPHVAGYGENGKRRGTLMVYEAFCRWAGLAAGPPAGPAAAADPLTLSTETGDVLTQAFDASCFVQRHDAAMRQLAALPAAQRAAAFDRLRRDYPPRRDFQDWEIGTDDREAEATLRKLGFQVRRRGMSRFV